MINAPTEFLHLMENCLIDICDEFVFPYRDDVIVCSDYLKNILVRSNADNGQRIMPTSYHWVIFKELHKNVAQLGADRVYHLPKDTV